MFALLLLLLGAACTESVTAQRMPERRPVRMGNRQYDKGNFERSIELYGRALSRDSSSFEAGYDMGNALFRAGRYDASEQMLRRVASDVSRTDAERAEAWFNLGDVQFAQQNLQGALESFKQSLRLNPSDMEAKYNYAYVKKLLEQQQNDENDQNDENNDKNNDGNNDKNNNKNNEGNNDKNNDKNNDGNDQKERNDDRNNNDKNNDENPDGDDNNDNNDNGGDEKNDGDGRPQQSAGEISPEQLEAMLDAIQAQEDKTQEKVNERQGVIVRGNKNW